MLTLIQIAFLKQWLDIHYWPFRSDCTWR